MKSIMKTQNIYFISIFLLIFSLRIEAQQMAHPVANSFGLAQQAAGPVNLSTGTLNVNIPLCGISSPWMNIPVSIGYAATGIRVAQIASPVGLGWTLNAGGAITRVVRDLPDEGENGFMNYLASDPNLGSYWEEGRGVFVADLESEVKTLQDLDVDYLEKFLGAEDGYDTEPDVFYFNFMGHTGKFVIGSDGTPRPIPNQNIRIYFEIKDKQVQITNTNLTVKTYEWVIMTEDGFTYHFNAGDQANELNLLYSGMKDEVYERSTPHISTWYLTDIYAPSGDLVAHFNYESLNIDNGAVELEYIANFIFNAIPNDCYPQNANYLYWENRTYLGQKYFLYSKVIKSIETSQGSIEFGYETGLRPEPFYEDNNSIKTLTSIEVKDELNQEFKKVQLLYDFFPFKEGSTKGRLKLEGIQIDNNPPYLMEYYEDNFMPHYNLTFNQKIIAPMKTDHWGFFNNEQPFPVVVNAAATDLTGGTTVPTLYNYIGRNRNFNFQDAITCMLKKVTYPTGASQTYEFEGHTYDCDKVWGGFRISKITTHDGFSTKNNQVQTYRYSCGSLNNALKAMNPYPNDPNIGMFTYYQAGIAPNPENQFERSDCQAFPPNHPQSQNYGYMNQNTLNKGKKTYDFLLRTESPASFASLLDQHLIYEQVSVEQVGKGSISYFFKNFENEPDIIQNKYSLRAKYINTHSTGYSTYSDESYTVQDGNNKYFIYPLSDSRSYARGLLERQIVYSEPEVHSDGTLGAIEVLSDIVYEYDIIEENTGIKGMKYYVPQTSYTPDTWNDLHDSYQLFYQPVIGFYEEKTAWVIPRKIIHTSLKDGTYLTHTTTNLYDEYDHGKGGGKGKYLMKVNEESRDEQGKYTLTNYQYQWLQNAYATTRSETSSNFGLSSSKILGVTETDYKLYNYRVGFDNLMSERMKFPSQELGNRIRGGFVNEEIWDWTNDKIYLPHQTKQTNLETPIDILLPNEELHELEVQTELLAYDTKGRPLEVWHRNQPKQSFIWSSNDNDLFAEVVNASYNDIRYTSFEEYNIVSGLTHYTAYIKNQNEITEFKAYSGENVYQIVDNNPLIIKSLDLNKTYKISCWAYALGFMESGSTPAALPNAEVIVANKSVSVGNKWQYVEAIVSGESSYEINLSTLNENPYVYIDELRVHPINAEMTTYTYNSLGQVTSVVDVNSFAQHYSYDEEEQLETVYTFERKVAEHYERTVDNKVLEKAKQKGILPPATPENIEMVYYQRSNTNGDIEITWNSSEGATSYKIEQLILTYPDFGSPVLTLEWHEVANVSTNSYQVNLAYSWVLIFRITAVGSTGKESSYTETSGYRFIPMPPSGGSAEYKASNSNTGNVCLNWNPVSQATGYKIYKETSPNQFTYLTTISDGNITQYCYSESRNNLQTRYRVTTLRDEEESIPRDLNIEFIPPPPENLEVIYHQTSDTQGDINITWAPSQDATSYKVYQQVFGYNPDVGGFELRWVEVAIVHTNSYETNNFPILFFLGFRVLAVGATGKESNYTEALDYQAVLLPPSGGSIKVQETAHNLASGTLTIDWNAVSGATAYKVYKQGQGDTYTLLATVSSNQYQTSLSSATQFNDRSRYRITTIRDAEESSHLELSNYTVIYLPPQRPQNLRFTSTPDPRLGGNLCLSWNAVLGATHYYVRYESNPGSGNFDQSSKVLDNGSTNGISRCYWITNPGTYTYRVYAHKGSNSVSPYSSISYEHRNIVLDPIELDPDPGGPIRLPRIPIISAGHEIATQILEIDAIK